MGFLDAGAGAWRFDIDEYEHYEQVGGWPGVGDQGWSGGEGSRGGRKYCGEGLQAARSHSSQWARAPRSRPSYMPSRIPPRRLPAHPHPQVENGDLNWILPGKLAAFSGPAARPTDYVGFRAMVPEDYWDYYQRRQVTAVVRLNKKVRRQCGREGWGGRGRGCEGAMGTSTSGSA
jgi:hypothetical protein